MRTHKKIQIASVATAALLAVTQAGMSFPAFAADGDYVYCCAALSWAEYWENEGVYLSDAASDDWSVASSEVDTRGEADLGAYDAVTRATSNHGLHRGSYQCTVKVYDTEGNSYNYTGKGNGESVDVVKGTDGTAITVDGETVGTYDHSVNIGPKYVPVAVPTALYDDFKQKYSVLENGDAMVGGYSEGNLKAIHETVAVSAETDGLKTVSQNEDGTYDFSKRVHRTSSAGKTVDGSALEISEVKRDSGYGDFIRVDINGDYGDLGAHMYAVRWDYYGDQDTVLASYGTKFAADNWMHKAMGIQLGLTESMRCELPAGYEDGNGRWDVTIYATGYQDYTFTIQAASDEYVYGTMDIPYADYYYGELGNQTNTTDGEISYTADLAGDAGMRTENTYDAVTSATTTKWQNQAGTYASEADENGGGKILGVSGVEVAIEKSLYDTLLADKAAANTSGVLGGLFDTFQANEDQKEPAAYKELYADGTLSATITQEPEVDLTNVTPTISTDSVWGDYQISMSGLDLGEDTVYGVVVTMQDGNQYGMLHLENIWRGGQELSWSVGVKTTEAKGNPLRSTPYLETSGATIAEISYLTDSGIYSVHSAEGLYLPKKHTAVITAEDTAVTAGTANVTIAGLPTDFASSIAVENLEGVSYADGKLTYDAAAAKVGKYTIDVTDRNNIYAHFTTDLFLTTENIPVVYNAESNELTVAEGLTDADLTAYLNNLATVTVNDTAYNASGRGAVTIIKKDGVVDFAAVKASRGESTKIFPTAGEYTLTVSAHGYLNDYTFTIQVPEEKKYVYGTVNLPYADYYYGELNDVEEDAAIHLDVVDPAAALRAEGYYDAVTSATNVKSEKYETTYYTENDDNSVTVEGIKDVAIAVPEELYNEAKEAMEAGTACQNQLLTIVGNLTANEDQTVVPAEYKVLNGDGTLTAMRDTNKAITVSDATIKVGTNTTYGNYQLSIVEADADNSLLPSASNMEGVLITMTDGSKYAMLHVDNLWLRTGEIAWATTENFVVHGVNILKYKSFEDTVGKSVASVRYIIRDGADVTYTAGENGAYLPLLHDGTATVEATPISAGSTTITLANLPETYQATATINGMETTYANGVLTFSPDAVQPGRYTITVSDASGVYAPIAVNVVLTTEQMPAVFDTATNSIVAAEGVNEADFANYLSKLSKATVNGEEYSLSGRGSTKIFDTKTGALDLGVTKNNEPIFAESGDYEIIVTATGYTVPLQFTVTVPEKTGEKGDVDVNGTVAVEDAVLVLTYYAQKSAGLNPDTGEQFANIMLGDIDGDGIISVEDAVFILTYYARQSAGLHPDWDTISG